MTWTAQYSTIDRLVHDMAFAGTGLQKAVADIEDTVFAKQFADINSDRPVFVTSLPRAGTTILLDLLATLPEFSAHTYREMPFLLCPLFWGSLSRAFQKSGQARDRAHGDGIKIDFDSVEAFEEALWQAWWPGKYSDNGIALWDGAEENDEFETFFDNHLKKIIALGRQRKSGKAARYISKNNNNIARLPELAKLYPKSHILVPLRAPQAHVRSLHRQHLRFLEAHNEDAFAKRYMRAIGHREFGANLNPIRFPGFDLPAKAATDANFWLEYWIAAFAMVEKLDLPQIRFVSYERLCGAPIDAIADILSTIEAGQAGDAERLAAKVTQPSSSGRQLSAKDSALDAGRLAVAETLYAELLSRTTQHPANGAVAA